MGRYQGRHKERAIPEGSAAAGDWTDASDGAGIDRDAEEFRAQEHPFDAVERAFDLFGFGVETAGEVFDVVHECIRVVGEGSAGIETAVFVEDALFVGGEGEALTGGVFAQAGGELGRSDAGFFGGDGAVEFGHLILVGAFGAGEGGLEGGGFWVLSTGFWVLGTGFGGHGRECSKIG